MTPDSGLGSFLVRIEDHQADRIPVSGRRSPAVRIGPTGGLVEIMPAPQMSPLHGPGGAGPHGLSVIPVQRSSVRSRTKVFTYGSLGSQRKRRRPPECSRVGCMPRPLMVLPRSPSAWRRTDATQYRIRPPVVNRLATFTSGWSNFSAHSSSRRSFASRLGHPLLGLIRPYVVRRTYSCRK